MSYYGDFDKAAVEKSNYIAVHNNLNGGNTWNTYYLPPGPRGGPHRDPPNSPVLDYLSTPEEKKARLSSSPIPKFGFPPIQMPPPEKAHHPSNARFAREEMTREQLMSELSRAEREIARVTKERDDLAKLIRDMNEKMEKQDAKSATLSKDNKEYKGRVECAMSILDPDNVGW